MHVPPPDSEAALQLSLNGGSATLGVVVVTLVHRGTGVNTTQPAAKLASLGNFVYCGFSNQQSTLVVAVMSASGPVLEAGRLAEKAAQFWSAAHSCAHSLAGVSARTSSSVVMSPAM